MLNFPYKNSHIIFIIRNYVDIRRQNKEFQITCDLSDKKRLTKLRVKFSAVGVYP